MYAVAASHCIHGSRVRITVRLGLGFGSVRHRAYAKVKVRVRFGSEIRKLRMRDFEIVQRILQGAQIDKPRATLALTATPQRRMH